MDAHLFAIYPNLGVHIYTIEVDDGPVKILFWVYSKCFTIPAGSSNCVTSGCGTDAFFRKWPYNFPGFLPSQSAAALLGLLLFKWRNRVADRPLKIPIPEGLARLFGPRALRRGAVRWPSILDRYVAMTYARMLGLSAVALASVFYIAEFTELSEKVFKGAATWAMLGMYLADKTPQYLYYVIPLSVLLAALVTIAMLTKNSELVVMKACGISLYRVAVPMIIGAILAGGSSRRRLRPLWTD